MPLTKCHTIGGSNDLLTRLRGAVAFIFIWGLGEFNKVGSTGDEWDATSRKELATGFFDKDIDEGEKRRNDAQRISGIAARNIRCRR